MTLQQLKYVIAIAEKGSINEAAKVQKCIDKISGQGERE